MNDELSTITLHDRLSPGGSPGAAVFDLTDYAWPSYRRTTLARGGDAGAGFSITGDKADETSLETWLETWLGAHVKESWEGAAVFMGRVHTMRLTYNGLFLVYSLDTCKNRIACRYTSIVDGSTYVTSFVDDTDSQAEWGVRELILQPEDIIGAAEASDLASKALQELAQPRIWRGDVQFSEAAPAVLQVDIEGYPSTLDDRHYNESSTATQDADADISDALTDADFVSEGTLEANSTQVSRKSEYRPTLQRIRYVAGRLDGSGNRYNFGCFGSLAFDYETATVNAARYYLQMKRRRPLMLDSNLNYVPAPLVQPGGVSLVTDTMPGRPFDTTLLNDPRAQFDEAVEYSAKGARLRGQWDLNSRVQALNMAVLARRRNG